MKQTEVSRLTIATFLKFCESQPGADVTILYVEPLTQSEVKVKVKKTKKKRKDFRCL
jgi:hypothetical protein